eukprot:TRINITY_DN3405_c0_g1_i1.p4 TRINITY_DN3405_c0_g1~~TRINITY_DN3405_c0_g1_i1.p4  ORF type:complete len:127 (-),score=35.63 TRINITY_DN3405_c0_g1_i1:430-810(-)
MPEAELIQHLTARLRRAQHTERQLDAYKRKYQEAARTSEQLLLQLGAEKQTVESLKNEIRSLTKHNVRLVEILGNVSQTTQSRALGTQPSPYYSGGSNAAMAATPTKPRGASGSGSAGGGGGARLW